MLSVKKMNYPKLMAVAVKSPSTGDFRNTFQRDRDRIMYGKAFRRLSGKTQVFVTGYDDHLRTRLTHSLEVSQIARTIGSFLTLNIDLIEAMAYGHDIGHAPFGHVGERAINYFANGCESYKGFNNRDPDHQASDDFLHPEYRGFKHNWQSVRILSDTARHHGKMGMGVSTQTLYGILNHTKPYFHKPDDTSDECMYLYHKHDHDNKLIGTYCKLRSRDNKVECSHPQWDLGYYLKRYSHINDPQFFTFEAIIVAISDEIAQRHHDIEDGLRFGIISTEDLIDQFKPLLERKTISKLGKTKDRDTFCSIISSRIVDHYVKRTIIRFQDYLGDIKGTRLREYLENKTVADVVDVWRYFEIDAYIPNDKRIKRFLMDRLLFSQEAQIMDGRAYHIISRLFHAYISNPQQLPNSTIQTFFESYNKFYDEFSGGVASSVANYRKDPSNYRAHLIKAHKNGLQDYKGIMLRTICDHIAGMTDRKALEEYHRLYGIDKDIVIK